MKRSFVKPIAGFWGGAIVESVFSYFVCCPIQQTHATADVALFSLFLSASLKGVHKLKVPKKGMPDELTQKAKTESAKKRYTR